MFTIIGNPPYIGKGEKLYLKVMSECEKFADSAVWLVPTDFVDNHRIKENINNKHIEILNERFESFSRIETVVGDAKFEDAEFFSDVGIFKFDQKKLDLYDLRFNRFSDPEKYKEITKIVDAYLVGKKTIGTEQGKKNTWYIQLWLIKGDIIFLLNSCQTNMLIYTACTFSSRNSKIPFFSPAFTPRISYSPKI